MQSRMTSRRKITDISYEKEDIERPQNN